MQVAEGVTRMVDQGAVNWYLVETGGGLVAVDAGFPAAWKDIQPRVHELEAIVITHAHVDHLGFAELARRETGVPVYVPQGDAQLARHPLRYARSERVPLLYLRYGATRTLYFRALKAGAAVGKTLRDFKVYGDGDELPGGLRAVFTPGHTDGHMALHLRDRDVLFTGDALVTRDPYTDREGPRLVARAATKDSERNLRSLDTIAATDAMTLLSGHGDPWTEGAGRAAQLAREHGAA